MEESKDRPIIYFEHADIYNSGSLVISDLTMSIADVFSLRAGLHHYCSHYGDAVWKRINPSQINNFWVTYKYERMDTVDIGVSIGPIDWLRVYVDMNFPVPVITTNLRPWIFAPNWLDQDSEPRTPYPDSYQALIVNFGVEFSYHIFESPGNTTIAYDCHMFQEGRIRQRLWTTEEHAHLQAE